MRAGKRAALYLRLSREDGDRDISQSIETQREQLLRYAAEQGFPVAGIYADDGYTGTNFNRPAFQRLIGDVEAGKIDIVLVKDLSRLGRDHIGVGEYVERYFPMHGVRFIALGDRIDTLYGVDKLAAFLFVLNDFYPRDISDKVRSALMTRKLAGRFIGSFAPYGYKKSSEAPGTLEPDAPAALIVRWIFRNFLRCGCLAEVVRALEACRIPPPSVYKGQRAQGTWNANTVRNILRNPTYIGNLTQNRSRKLGVKLSRQIRLPETEWITVAHTHPPLISTAQFTLAQTLLQSRTGTRALQSTELMI